MNAWKLACLLKERGMNCVRCRVCDKIDIVGTNKSEAMTWITPCRCPEPVHMKCLEEKLGLSQSLYSLEKAKLILKRLFGRRKKDGEFDEDASLVFGENLKPKLWVSYDSPNDEDNTDLNGSMTRRSPVHVDEFNKFTSSTAKCSRCGVQYSRALRLPRTIHEVVYSSLSDRLAILRAISTFAHFLLCIWFIAVMEAKCVDQGRCANLIDISPFKNISLKSH